MSYPADLPSYIVPDPAKTLDEDNHTARHAQEEADIEALGEKVGVGASTPSVGKVLRATGVGESEWGPLDLSTDVEGELPIANIGGVLPIDQGGTGADTAEDARTALGIATEEDIVAAALEAVYPVGAVYTELTGVNPSTTFGFGTWAAFGDGRVLVGFDSGQAEFDSVRQTAGETTHTLIASEMPAHNHTGTTSSDGNHQHASVTRWAGVRATAAAAEVGTHPNRGTGDNTSSATDANGTHSHTFTTSTSGSGAAHNNLQPYIVVYFWERTA